ncbi:MAG TPA: VCBS repeat-containing protein [Gemmataceae bacterium]|nr:VCBS repeat-containing protein [Gemmataceae bacterium]
MSRVENQHVRRPSRNQRRLCIEPLEDRSVPAFVAATSYTVGSNKGTESNPVAVATGDFNHDGKIDIVTANHGTKDVTLLSGTGTGGIKSTANFAINRVPYGIAVADLNGDGNLDVVTANKDDNSITFLFGNGAGSFSTITSAAAGPGPIAVAVGDVNGDGMPDLAIANNGDSTVSVLIGNGTGGFTLGSTVNVGGSPLAVVLRDFDADGHVDIGSVGSSKVAINLNNGNGTFAAVIQTAAGTSPADMAVGDFNGDGKLDVAVPVPFATGDGVNVLLGNGDGSFAAAVNYDAGGQTPRSIAVGDLNGDGALDIVTANDQFANNSVSVVMGVGDGTFGPAYVYTAGQTPIDVALGDLNGDHMPDVIAATQGKFLGTSVGTIDVLLDNGDGTLLSSQSLAVPHPTAPVVADFNNDGALDLAVATFIPGYVGVYVFPGYGNGLFGAPIKTVPIDIGVLTAGLAAGDFNGDGKPDLAVGSSGGVSILIGAGDCTFGSATVFPAGGSPSWIAVDDFDADGKLDLAVANDSSDGADILLGAGNGSFGSPISTNIGAGASHLATSDFNGDGKRDLVVVTSSNAYVMTGLGTGQFNAATAYPLGAAPGEVAIGDFNKDGKKDFAIPSFIPGVLTTFMNTGNGAFVQKYQYPGDSKPNGLAVGDFTGDGKLDLAMSNEFSDNLYIYPGTGTGTFGTPLSYSVGDRPQWVTSADFNKDGKPDLLVVNSNSGTVTLLESAAATATRFRVHVASKVVTAGVPVLVTVSAQDAGGRLIRGFSGSVRLVSSSAATLPAPFVFSPANGGIHTFLVTFKKSGPVTISAKLGGITGSDAITVVPATANHFGIVGLTNVVAGIPNTLTVSALDRFNNVDPTYVGTVHFTSTASPLAGLPLDYTFVPTENGVHAFSVSVNKAGKQTVAVTDTARPTFRGTATATVVAGAVDSFLITKFPLTTKANAAHGFTVTAKDAYGNTVTNYTGTVVFSNTGGAALLPPSFTFTTKNKGKHSFKATFQTVGTGETLTVQDQNDPSIAGTLTGITVT